MWKLLSKFSVTPEDRDKKRKTPLDGDDEDDGCKEEETSRATVVYNATNMSAKYIADMYMKAKEPYDVVHSLCLCVDESTRSSITLICSDAGMLAISEMAKSDSRLEDLVDFVRAVKEASYGISLLNAVTPLSTRPNTVHDPCKLRDFIRQCAFNVFLDELSAVNKSSSDPRNPRPSIAADGPEEDGDGGAARPHQHHHRRIRRASEEAAAQNSEPRSD
jgi:SpoVK/Ycf46/Vps4 family AAA+-type ATPase